MASAVLTVITALANATWAVALVVAAIMPADDGPGFAIPDWAAHGLGYGVQAGLLWIQLLRLGTGRGGGRALWSVAGATALGALTELLQTTRPDRSAEWRDLLADAVGAVLVVAALECWRWAQGVSEGNPG